MAEEVTVSSNRMPPAKRPDPRGLSPLQAGLLYGTAGVALGGPFGLLAGLAAGLVSNRQKKNYLDKIAADSENTQNEYNTLQEQFKSELALADPDEARLIKDAQDTAANGWYRLQSGDDTGRAMIEQAHETMRGIINADIQARKSEQASQFNAQRGLITSAAPALRDQYSTIINQARDTDARAQRILKLVADPNFDPDKPFSKSVLTELVSSSLGGMFREDPNGLLNGLSELGSTGSEIGTIVGAIAKLGKSVADTDEFKISREEYNRIALNIREVTRQYGSQRLQELGQQAQNLDTWAKQVGVISNDYSLRDYVSGGVKELSIAAPITLPSIRTDSKTSSPRTQQWQSPPTLPQQRRPQVAAPELPSILSDDWFRQKLGIPTQRRPTN